MTFMTTKTNLSIFTGSRAEYGLLYWVIKELIESDVFNVKVVATGTHLSKKMGNTISKVREDFKDKVHEIDINTVGTSPNDISKMVSNGVTLVSNFFANTKVDLAVILGDRFEILSVAVAALPHNIPIAHIGGGEVSEGVIDDSIRHVITKLSHIHFPINNKCGERIKALGEDPSNIHVVGSTSLDILKNIDFVSKSSLSDLIGFDKRKKLMLFVYHPETIDYKNNLENIDEILNAISEVDFEIIMIYPNIDTLSDFIIDKLENFSIGKDNVFLVKNLDRNIYLSIMECADVMVGNSSSGIVESPSFSIPVVNIGNRQNGRDKSENVIDCKNSYSSVLSAINAAINDGEFKSRISKMKNPNRPVSVKI